MRKQQNELTKLVNNPDVKTLGDSIEKTIDAVVQVGDFLGNQQGYEKEDVDDVLRDIREANRLLRSALSKVINLELGIPIP